MGKRNRGRSQRKRQGGGHPARRDKDAQLADSMAKIHELFIKLEDEFKGCTISGVAIDSNSGAACIHVEEHNKVLMFYATDFAIGEHAGKLSDMLLNAGFVVPDVVQESWNESIIDMVNSYVRAVVAGQDAPETVDGGKIQALLGSYYKPEQAAALIEETRQEVEARKKTRQEEGEEERLKVLRGGEEDVPADGEGVSEEQETSEA